MPDQQLGYDFFNRNVVEVAKDLLGKKLVFGKYQGIITETEGYRGDDDPASHAYRGATKRSKIMFASAGFCYVYLIYGMYHCINFVAENPGQAGAVLIRGLQLLQPDKQYLDGPGKLCRKLGITREHNGIDVTTSKDMYLLPGVQIDKYHQSTRIGIKVATDKLWRFYFTP